MKKRETGFHGAALENATVASTMQKFRIVQYVSFFSLVAGTLLAALGLLSTLGVSSKEVSSWTGLVAYILTMWVPGLAVARIRVMHIQMSKDSPDTYDSYTGQKIARTLRKFALLGLISSLFAIYVFIVPFAESMA